MAASAVVKGVAQACAASFRVPRECSPRTGGNTGRERGTTEELAPPLAPTTYPLSHSGRPASTTAWAFPRGAPAPIITLPRATRPPTLKSFGRRGTSRTGTFYFSSFPSASACPEVRSSAASFPQLLLQGREVFLYVHKKRHA